MSTMDSPNWQFPPGTSQADKHKGTLALGVAQSEVLLFEGFETEPLGFSFVGDWARSNTMARTGTWSFQSADIDDDEMSDAEITLPVGTNAVRLFYRVDSEPFFDFFRVLVDGNQVFESSGDVDWTELVVDTSGATTLTLRYVKDAFASDGGDTVWVDDMEFLSGLPLYQALSLDSENRLRVVAEEVPATPPTLEDFGAPFEFTGASAIPDATYRGWTLTVVEGPVLVNSLTVPTGYTLSRSGDTGQTAPGVAFDATGGRIVVDFLGEI